MFFVFLIVLAIVATVLDSCYAFTIIPQTLRSKLHSRLLASVEETVTVRFVNTPNGEDVLVRNVDQGSNLLAVADNAGVRLPRACRTGLCGSCTCEIQDPTATASEFNPREGYLTIRACSARCVPPEGMQELVVDVGRMRKVKRKGGADTPSSQDLQFEQEVRNRLSPHLFSFASFSLC